LSNGDNAALRAPQSEQPYPSSFRAWFLVFVLFLAYAASLMDRQIVTMLVEPMKHDLHFTDAAIGMAMGLSFSLAYIVAVGPLGYLADRLSRKRLLGWGVGIWSLLSASCGLAKTIPILFMMRAGVGGVESVMSPAALPMISDAFPRERRAIPMGLYVCGAALGASFAVFLGGFILEATSHFSPTVLPVIGMFYPWQLTYVAAGAFGLIVVALLAFAREPQRRDERAAEAGLDGALGYFRKHAAAYATAFLLPGLMGMIHFGIVSWMPAFLQRIGHLGHPEISAGLFPATLASGLFGPSLGGFILHRAIKNNKPANAIDALGWLIVIEALSLLASLLTPAPYNFILLAIGGVSSNALIGLSLIAVPTITPSQFRSRAVAILTLAYAGIGFGVGPWIIGALATDVFGERHLLSAMAALIAAAPIAFVIFLAGRRTYIAEITPSETAGRDDDIGIPAEAMI
jgi:MFS family permease